MKAIFKKTEIGFSFPASTLAEGQQNISIGKEKKWFCSCFLKYGLLSRFVVVVFYSNKAQTVT